MLKKGMFIGERYEILELIGSGGMSDVYKAKCHKLNRFVAIKVLKKEFAQDKNFLMKFKVEAQSVAGLTHSNIVNVYDVGTDDGINYIVMEYVEGITLKRYIEKKKRLGVKEAVSIAIQVAQGIEAAHNNQIVHRDIKPQNILISREGKVKVTDFGIARAASANTVTSSAAMGSVHYISPEQARGGFVDEKSDIYSLGITMFEMLTGHVPFDGDSTVTIALRQIQDELPSIRAEVPEVPMSVCRIIEKCTQKKPDRRYLKVSSLIADLKKSLISPDEDFVKIIPVNDNSSTVMLSDAEVTAIRNGSREDSLKESALEDDLNDDGFEEDDELNEVNPKLDKLITIGSIAAGVVILIIFILLIVKFLGGLESCSGSTSTETTTQEVSAAQVEVPELVGLSEDEIRASLENLALGVKFTYEASNDVEQGLAISQSVGAGEMVDENTTIEVAISQGKEEVLVPDLIGKSKSDAIAQLTALGLNNTVVTEYNAGYPLDTVYNTTPGASEKVKYGDTITLYVSRGAEVKSVEVPNLMGLTKTQAENALISVGLTLGKVTYEETTAANIDKVIRQLTTAYSVLEQGSSVDVVLGKETPTETTTVTETTTKKNDSGQATQ
ncbi:Stk1 family PASTA domain-containing Ser/Thr kinase [Parasporobacterium paucivorans]|uniref:non-specific serine/threonine protein kinase n=1 Tax=Parasporobacterium paucivorans DSM 15970 TaxID=1122934 RepID=A0A1M6ERH6_9FIRM|nr:Stk1 family PASTA domain-containing Ser/Thr kinase [Parasporobacterium paucivorans]SHI88104.1 serine/threonine protein kinase [Parasporobacterium paucivorans DSM 15970]